MAALSRRDLPNIITVVRIGLVVPIAVLMLEREWVAALAVFALAGFSDAVDGFLARRYQWTSSLGSWLDPAADKLLLVTSYVVLAWVGVLPVWLSVAVIARDIIIVAGSLVYYFWIERSAASPSLISKINTGVQILLVATVVLDQAWLPIPPSWLHALIIITGTTTVLSGMDYVGTWGLRAWRLRRGESHD